MAGTSEIKVHKSRSEAFRENESEQHNIGVTIRFFKTVSFLILSETTQYTFIIVPAVQDGGGNTRTYLSLGAVKLMKNTTGKIKKKWILILPTSVFFVKF